MQNYLDMMYDIVDEGSERDDRTNTGTWDSFGRQLRFNLLKGFPIVTTKKINFKNIVGELLWFLQGGCHLKDLAAITHGDEKAGTIWDDWADPSGYLGPIYGVQWRYYGGLDGEPVDQIAQLMHNLKHKPFSRRHVITAWNPCDLPNEDLSPNVNAENGQMCLPPCHCLFQFHVDSPGDGHKYLSCQLYQRSADMFIGVPYNIASYALLTHLIAQQLDMTPYMFVHTFGSAHVYKNHIDQVSTQLERDPHPLPELRIKRKLNNLESYKVDDFELINYKHHPFIKAPVAV
jgi:thymidylate synthase